MSAPTLWPARVRVARGPGGSRVLIDRRSVICAVSLALVLVIVAGVAITLGESDLPDSEVLPALLGIGDPATLRIVAEWRLPRIVLAIMGGASLALSGAIFQSLTRNPLGSPDIIGLSTGAYTGALITTFVIGASTIVVPLGAFIGGLATAAVVYALAYTRGAQGFRLIVVGIAVSAMLVAVNSYILVQARLEEAVTAAIWGAGTLNGARWPEVTPIVASLVVLGGLCALLSRRLLLLELGDEHARALGINVERTRVIVLIVGVGLVATITAVAGPITFVALAAPQIAKRLVDSAGPALAVSALSGSVLLLVSDIIAQRVIAPGQLPVGVVTACLGGGYLVWLLTRGMKDRA